MFKIKLFGIVNPARKLPRRLAVVIVSLFATLSVSAYVMVDGIYYNILSEKNLTCGVIEGDYKGNIVIPEKVTYNGKTYSVTSIGFSAFNIAHLLRALSFQTP